MVELNLLWTGRIHVEVTGAVGANTTSLSLYSTWLNTLKEQERASAFIFLCWGPWAAQASHQQPCSFAQNLLQNTKQRVSVRLHCPLACCLMWSSGNNSIAIWSEKTTAEHEWCTSAVLCWTIWKSIRRDLGNSSYLFHLAVCPLPAQTQV